MPPRNIKLKSKKGHDGMQTIGKGYLQYKMSSCTWPQLHKYKLVAAGASRIQSYRIIIHIIRHDTVLFVIRHYTYLRTKMAWHEVEHQKN